MCRHARLDRPGCRHHVTCHAIGDIPLFVDDHDRRCFLRDVESIFVESGTRCFAWALMTNHVHLLVETGRAPLAKVMQRLLQRHAQRFNRRHRHRGHVMQNRYDSRVVDGENYLLLAVRYVHLNPVAAGLVPGPAALERFAWTGHAALMGQRRNGFQDVQGVLSLMGPDQTSARHAMRRFVGTALGTSADPLPGAATMTFSARAQKEACVYGVRALHARSAFIDRVMDDIASRDARRASLRHAGWTIDRVLIDVCHRHRVPRHLVAGGSRAGRCSRARAVVAFIACECLGMTQTQVARRLGVGQTSVARALVRGRSAGQQWLRDAHR